MPDTKMSDMIDAHSGFFQSVTSIHAMAEDLTVSDKHIFKLPVFPFHISHICPIRKKIVVMHIVGGEMDKIAQHSNFAILSKNVNISGVQENTILYHTLVSFIVRANIM